jgi:hypothetical protein
MSAKYPRIVSLLCLLACCTFNLPSALAQQASEGSVVVTVVDPTGGVVQGAQLELRDLTSGDARTAVTGDRGTYTFVNLSLGKYKLTISKTGFKNEVLNNVISQAAQTTDVTASLKVGATVETVEVDASAAPVIEESSNAIGTTIDLKQIEDLPLQGRNLSALSQLVPGYGGVNGSGTYDGLPAIAQGNSVDGIISSTSRMKFGGNDSPAITPRLEDMQEMTVQTEQLGLEQGNGQSNMAVNFITRRGSNAFHGRLFEDYRNSAFDANSWVNDEQTAAGSPTPKNLLILNDFGGSVGGPIIKNKLFFFGSFAESRQPGSYTATNNVFTAAAEAGNYTYGGNTVNLFTLAGNYNATHPGANLPTAVNPNTAGILASIDTAKTSGVQSPTNDPNFNILSWQQPNPTTNYFPTVRVDYNASAKIRFNVAWNMTKSSQPGANEPDFPGSAWTNTGTGNSFKDYTAAFGFGWTISPNLINEFRGGFLYNDQTNSYNAPPLSINNPQLAWNYPGAINGSQESGTIFYALTGQYYPIFNASDTMTWQHGAHTMNFGYSWWYEKDHYYNNVQGFPVVTLGLAPGDPAQNAFTSGGTLPGASTGQQNAAQQLYAILTARISNVNGSYAINPSSGQYEQKVGAYNLDELTGGQGLFFQDSYRLRPNLTLNYGLRWDFTAADHDLSNLYHSVNTASVYGPTGVGNLFNPGSLQGDLNPMITQNSHPYNGWNIAPQPAFGFAWNPSAGKTVIRGGFSLRDETEPQQYVWNEATDYQAFYYQTFGLNANTSGAPGTFAPGTLSMSNFNSSAAPTVAFGAPYFLAPQAYLKTEAASDFTFLGGPGLAGFSPINGMKQNIQQPYTESWNLGIQRQLGQSRALEVRYVGSLSPHQWITINPNEVNIFENHFLDQFKIAQANLAAYTQANPTCVAAGTCSFANNGLPGQQAMPIMAAAFQGPGEGGSTCAGGASDYCASNFITDLNTGSAGAMAGTLAGINGTVPYLCNLVGAAAFSPCANNVGAGSFNAAGAGYPINFFQANPYAQNPYGGTGTTYTEAEGVSTYHALQVDFRQRSWRGLQFDANYTWSHTLGDTTQNNWQGIPNIFTLRNMNLGYGPTLFDLRNVVHINGTYDLPFGKGKEFANRGGVVDRVVGGWTVGTIFTFQTGAPFYLVGGNANFNDYGDGGVVLNGVTASQLQSAVGTYHIPGSVQVAFLNPKYLSSTGSNQAYLAPNTTPGVIGQRIWLYGPHNTFDDVSISKHIPITEKVLFNFQAELLNAFNHPTFGPGAGNGGTGNYGFNAIQNSSGFGLSTGTLYNPNSPNGGARVIEFRGNIEF